MASVRVSGRRVSTVRPARPGSRSRCCRIRVLDIWPGPPCRGAYSLISPPGIGRRDLGHELLVCAAGFGHPARSEAMEFICAPSAVPRPSRSGTGAVRRRQIHQRRAPVGRDWPAGAPSGHGRSGAPVTDDDALLLWGGRGAVADLGGPVHHVDFGGPSAGPRVVLVHGLGGSHLNWCLAAPGLAERAGARALDLPGFGLSEPGGRSSAVRANVAVLDRFIREVVGAPVVLVGNSMGGMISILEAAGAPAAVSGLLLVDAALPVPRLQRIDPAGGLGFSPFSLPRGGAPPAAPRP